MSAIWESRRSTETGDLCHLLNYGPSGQGQLKWWGRWEAYVEYFSKAQWSIPVLHLRHLPHPCCCANLFPCLENDPQAIYIPFCPLSQFYCRGHRFSLRQVVDPSSPPCFHCEQCYHFLLSEWSNHHPVVETCHPLPTERIMKSEPLGTQGEETLALLLGLSSQFLLHSQPRSLFLFHSQLCSGLGFLPGAHTCHTHCGY